MKYWGIPDVEHLDEWTALDIPFEYNDFMWPQVLDDPSEIRRRVSLYREADRDRSRDTLHGPFLDITVHSSDRLIQKVSDRRLREAGEISVELGVKAMIVHTNFIPNFYQKAYRDGWADRNEEYFRKFLEDFPSLWIYMENMFDEEPDCLTELAGRMRGERFAVCLDLAHAHISGTPLQDWLSACNPYVAHYHINDNFGKIDEHLPVGDGSVPWDEVLPLMKKEASVLIEVNSMESYKKSAAFLAKYQ